MVCEGGGEGGSSSYGYNIESSEAETCRGVVGGFNFGGCYVGGGEEVYV